MTKPPKFVSHIFLAVLLVILSGCADMVQSIPQLRSTSTGQSMQVRSKVSTVIDAQFSPDGMSLLSGGTSPQLRAWSLTDASQSRTIPIPITGGSTNQVQKISYSPDSKFIAVGYRTGIFCCDESLLLNANTGQEIGKFPMARDLAFTNDGKFLVGTAVDGTDVAARIVDVSNKQIVHEFKGYLHVAVSPANHEIVMSSRFGANSELVAYDYSGNHEIWRQEVGHFVTSIALSPDGMFLVAGSVIDDPFSGLEIYLDLFDARTGRHIKEIEHSKLSISMFSPDRMFSWISRITYSPDGDYFLTANSKGVYKLWESKSLTMIRQFDRPDEKIVFGFSAGSGSFLPNGKVVALSSAASVRLYAVDSGKEIATFIAFDNGEWLISTPSGYYNASKNGDEFLDVTVEGKAYSTSQLREAFFRPDLVKVALAGDSLSEFKKIADIKQPPVLSIVDTPTSVTTGEVTISLQVKDQGGGIGDVRLYRNGTAVVLEKTRNLQIVSNATAGQILHYTVSLEPGKNNIRAIAFNGDNTMQSGDASIDIDAKVAPRQPALYAVVVGIQNFLNPRLNLSYSVADANLFADTLERQGKGLYSSIRIHRLLTPKDTTKEALVTALTQARVEVRPEDLFVFYVASHGTVNDGQYLLITSNVGSTLMNKLKQDSLTQDELKGMISNIPASKKLVVLDTCDAGKMGDALQVALLTRGMSNDTAMNILSRAVGSTILSAATSDQEAVEGYKGHGLFTYVVTQGLKGEADTDRDGFVKTLELANYVDSKVPELAMTVFKHRQYPIISPSGQGFPLVRVSQ